MKNNNFIPERDVEYDRYLKHDNNNNENYISYQTNFFQQSFFFHFFS